MRVAVGSTNPTKVSAVIDVLGDHVEIFSISADSSVSEQPFGDRETIQGASNRAKECMKEGVFDIAIGLEGGVCETEFGLMVINWGALVDNQGNEWVASGARAVLPNEIVNHVRKGKTLGEAMDLYTKRYEVSKKEGAMGIITNGRILRHEMFSHVVKALVGQYEFHKNKNGV